MNFKLMVLVCVSAVGFASCQLKVTEQAASEDAGSIIGDWTTDCMADGNDSYIKMYSIAGGTMVTTYAAFYYTGDRFCNQANLSVSEIHSGTMTETDGNSISGAQNYELKLSSSFLTPGSNNTAAGFNAGTICGYNDWSKDASKLIFGCSAPGFIDASNVMPNTTDYGVFKIVTSVSPNYVQFGTKCAVAGYQDLCPTDLDRPSTLDGTVYYKR